MFKAHLVRNTAQEAPSPQAGADEVTGTGREGLGEMEAHDASPHHSARSLVGPLRNDTRRCQLPSATGKPGRTSEKSAPGTRSA
jgi:hypothetical protein